MYSYLHNMRNMCMVVPCLYVAYTALLTSFYTSWLACDIWVPPCGSCTVQAEWAWAYCGSSNLDWDPCKHYLTCRIWLQCGRWAWWKGTRFAQRVFTINNSLHNSSPSLLISIYGQYIRFDVWSLSYRILKFGVYYLGQWKPIQFALIPCM